MAELRTTAGQTSIDYTGRDYEALLAAMRAQIPELMPEWTEYESEADFGNVLLQLFAHVGDMLSYYLDRVANESFLGTAQSRRSVINHLRLIGYRLATAAPASALLTVSFPASVTEQVEIRQGDAFATASQRDRPSVRFEYTRATPLVINCAELPVTAGKRVFAGLPIEEGRLVRGERIGVSSGQRDQRFDLARSGLILRPLGQGRATDTDLLLIVETPAGPERWSLRETLAFSRAAQKDYLVEIDDQDRASVVFGDGHFGAIPPAGAVISATYRVGGGVQGNVGPNTIRTIVGAPRLALLGATVANPQAATGGDDREQIDRAVRQAPAVFRSLQRAVTEDDYRALAMNFQGVGKVAARAAGWNTVRLYIAPAGGGPLSDVLRKNLLTYFEDKRPITTQIEVEGVIYVPVYVRIELEIESYYSPDDVRERARTAAEAILAFERVEFGQTVYLSKFYEAVEAVEGVRAVFISRFTRESEEQRLIEGQGRISMESTESRVPELPTPAVAVVMRGEES